MDRSRAAYQQAANLISPHAFRDLAGTSFITSGGSSVVTVVERPPGAVRVQFTPGDGSTYDTVMVRLHDGISVHVISFGVCAMLPFDPGADELHWLYVHEKLRPHNELTSKAVAGLVNRAQAAVAELADLRYQVGTLDQGGDHAD